MKQFKVGDIVIPHKPKNVNERPTFVSDMTSFCGTKQVIARVFRNGRRAELVSGEGWTWNTKWLEPYDSDNNQFSNKCRWCKDVKTIQKKIDSVNVTFNYCPECGR